MPLCLKMIESFVIKIMQYNELDFIITYYIG